jgi:sugar transferase (PEP-CTERM/EpsH1 system associated)
MAKILFLAHRAPFPPDKGDKIRAYHLLQHLAPRHEVWLGACVDDPRDEHERPAIGLLSGACLPALRPGRRAWNMLCAALSGAPLSVARFRHPVLARWIDDVLREVGPDLVVVFSSALSQYVVGRGRPGPGLIIDFVDADAQKWLAYAQGAPPPARWAYRAEARRLVRFEQRALDAAAAGIMISETERRLQAALTPRGANKLSIIPNGVDTQFFRPGPRRMDRDGIVFCGRMDYAPNIDGVEWFAREILPRVRDLCPQAVFRIVGAAPVARVLALRAIPGVEVTGGVADVRPYLDAAAVIVAPLRIARGIQNKVLEGLAMGRPVVATPDALDGIAAQPGREVLVGAGAEAFATAVTDVLTGRSPADLGPRGRRFVLRHHRWSAHLQALDRLIATVLADLSGETSTEQGRDAVGEAQGQATPRPNGGRVALIGGVEVRQRL